MAFDLLSKIFPSKSYLGVDIGTTSIKIVELKKAGPKPVLRGYCLLESHAHLENLGSAIQTSNLKMMDKETAGYLKMALDGLGTKTQEAVASVPAFSAFTTLIEMPLMSASDTGKAMDFQMKQYVPMPLSEVTTDWVKVAEKKGEAGQPIQQVLLVSIPNELIEKYKNIFQTVGLKLTGLEIEGLSLARVLTAGPGETTMIVDIGSRSSSILIARAGFLKFISQTDFASGSLTQNIASGLNLSAAQAEELKRQRGIAAELSTLQTPVLDAIINEGKSVKESFEKSYKEEIKRVIVTGGGANLVGIDKYFGQQFGLPTAKDSSFAVVSYPAELEPLIRELSPTFAIAIGLAMRNM